MKIIRNRISAMALTYAFCMSMISVPVAAEDELLFKYDGLVQQYEIEGMPENPILGDANSDGAVNALDAANILCFAALAGTANPIPEEDGVDSRVSDVTGDGLFNAKDAAVILSYAANAGTGYEGTLEEYVSQRAEPEYYGAQYVSMLFGDIYRAFSDKTFLITSPAELEAFVDKMNEINEYFDTRTSTDAAEVCGIPLADTVAKYDEAWFKEHDLIMVIAEEYATQIHHAVRGITKNEDGSWTVAIDRLIPAASELTVPSFAIFVETNKAVELAPAVNVEMTTVHLKP